MNMSHYRKAIASPVKSKKAKKRTSTNASGNAKYHFCFSPIDMRSCTKMYGIVEKLLSKPTFELGDEHYIYLYMDQERLTHIDFNGEEWTCEETDEIFSQIRSAFRENSMYFAFTNFKED